MDTTHPSDPLIIAGRYRVIRPLGQGGMGAVYEAENLRTKRRVAVKTMRPEVAARAEYARRFEREAQAAGQLRHPNIVDVLDLGEDLELGLVFIVQEFLAGGDLRRCLTVKRALPPHNVLATLLPIVDALATAHAAGIVHRDMKPDNIFLHETSHGVVPKLIDFGIAKFADGGADASRTAMGALLGSPSYMSPEQARGDSSLDGRTDIWSMGVVFHEALSGRLPYDAPTTNVLLAKIIFEEPIALASMVPSLPADLAAAIQRAVTRDLGARWPTMRAFHDALAACALWQSIDPAHAPRWIVNAAGVALDSRVSAAPPEAIPRGEPEAPRSPSGETSAQRSGLWHGEVTAAPPRSNRLRIAAVVVAAATVLALVAIVTRSPPRPAAAPATTVLTYRPAAPAREPAVAPVVVPPSPPVVVPVQPPAVSTETATAGRRPRRLVRQPVAAVPPPAAVRERPAARPIESGTNGSLIMQ